MSNERHAAVQETLERLRSRTGATGAFLLSRDGLLLGESVDHPLNRELFSAMAATVIGGAEMALAELGATRVRLVRVQADRAAMLIANVSDEHMLVLLAATEAELRDDPQAVREAAERLAAALGTTVK